MGALSYPTPTKPSVCVRLKLLIVPLTVICRMINTAFKQARWVLWCQCVGEHILFGIGLGTSVNTAHHHGGHLEPLLLQSTPPLVYIIQSMLQHRAFLVGASPR